MGISGCSLGALVMVQMLHGLTCMTVGTTLGSLNLSCIISTILTYGSTDLIKVSIWARIGIDLLTQHKTWSLVAVHNLAQD